MAGYDRDENEAISPRLRLLLMTLGLGLTSLLVVAGYLKPNPFQYGTHQQLGLPPCTFVLLFGEPCPTCGSTTAWAYLVRCKLFAALQANVGGTLLGLWALWFVPWSMVSAVRGHWFVCKPNGKIAGYISTVIIAVMLIQWVFRLLMK